VKILRSTVRWDSAVGFMITGTRPSIGSIPNKNQFAAVVRIFGNKKDRPMDRGALADRLDLARARWTRII
jgi:hypothetical protein